MSVAGAVTTPVGVKTSPRIAEASSAAAGRWLTWTHDSPAHRLVFNVYAQKNGRAPVKLNARGTHADNGGIDGHVAVFAEYARSGRGTVYLYDLVTHHRTAVASSVTGRYPTGASLSGRWLTFERQLPGAEGPRSAIVLYDRTRRTLKRLDVGSYRAVAVYAGQVNRPWVVWRHADFTADTTTSEVRRYNTVTKKTFTVPNPAGYLAWGPSVSGDGTVFFVRMRNDEAGNQVGGCELVRYPTGGPASVLATFTARVPDDTYVRDNPDGSKTVFFTLTSSDVHKSDIFKIHSE